MSLSQTHRPSRALGCVLLLACLVPVVGCVDSEALIAQRREEVKRLQLEEVDLGRFYTTLPPTNPEGNTGAVNFHAFVRVANRDRNEVEEAVEHFGPHMKHELLMAIRHLSPDELIDPDSNLLREELIKAVNQPLEKPLVQEAGFYMFKFYPL